MSFIKLIKVTFTRCAFDIEGGEINECGKQGKIFKYGYSNIYVSINYLFYKTYPK